ncbi:MAG: hypothetical protein HY914_10910 [Desulfomonile tiedjei]|nr:hypothetical protein [Desulfomonile tiedjei]
MRYGKVVPVLIVAAMAVLVVLVGVARADQSLGTSSSATAAMGRTVLADRVVNPEGTMLQVPVTNVDWRGRHYGGRHSGYWRPYNKFRSYYYSYPRPRCWWNGYRWVCKYRGRGVY